MLVIALVAAVLGTVTVILVEVRNNHDGRLDVSPDMLTPFPGAWPVTHTWPG